MVGLKKLGRGTGVPYVIIVAVLHLFGLGLLYVGCKTSPTLFGMGFVAYTLGLRHAFDVDHIAAIDNTVRKLSQEEKNPSGVGFYFSLGHSSVVFIMAIVTAVTVQWAKHTIPQLQVIGGLVGTIISGAFLILIGVLNFVILKELYKIFKQMKNGLYDKDQVEELLLSRGFMSRFLKPLFKIVNKSWQMYPIGFLFGLGFDTASEVALLAISASAAQTSIPFLGVLSLPVLFASGMSLMDTADGIFMMKAYQWAFYTPFRKVYYNLTITSISVIAALLIGVIEVVQVLSQELGLNNGFFNWIQSLDFGLMGYGLVAIFLLAWGISFIIWKVMKIEEREERKIYDLR